MNKRRNLGILIAPLRGTFIACALGAGSDVVQYPANENPANEPSTGRPVKEHHGIGVPMPRVRTFVKAPWIEDVRHSEPFCELTDASYRTESGAGVD